MHTDELCLITCQTGSAGEHGGEGARTCKLCDDTGAGAAAAAASGSGLDCWSGLAPPLARVGSVLTMSSCWGHATGRSACCAVALACSVAAPSAPTGLRWRWSIGPQCGCMKAQHAGQPFRAVGMCMLEPLCHP